MKSPCRRRRGTILIVAIGVLMILTGFTLVFCRQMRIEALASANFVAGADATIIERAAEQFAIAEIVDQQDAVLNLPDTTFAAVPVGDGYFWILRPYYDDDSLPTFGLVDEGSKLNINTATSDMLQLLPGMTPDVADSIYDWHDTSGNGGQDSTYYQTLPSPYVSKIAPYDTLEELLLIRGVTHEMLYGQPQSASMGDPQLARGINDLLTVYSTEQNVNANGLPRINVNSNSQQLDDLLSRTIGSGRTTTITRSIGRTATYQNIFDFARRNAMTQDQFAQIADLITTSNQKTITGRVNVNTAPRDVLLCLPNLDDSDVDAIIANRNSAQGTSTDISWLIQAIPAKVTAIGSYVTGRSFQYSADIIAVSGNGRSFKRFRVVIDTTPSAASIAAGTTTTTPPPPRIVYRRDITDSGFPLDSSILTSLRQGAGLPAIATSPQARRSL